MEECFKCGISSDKTILFDVISKKGIKKICKNCLEEEDLPVIKTTTDIQFKEANKDSKKTVYQRLSKITGFNPSAYEKNKKLEKENQKIQKIASQKPVEKAQIDKKSSGLIEHFNWVIMRRRRMEKLTKKEFAEKIKETEQIIKLIESGTLPKNYIEIFLKIERELNIILITNEKRENLFKQPDYLDFEKKGFENLKISDLQEMKKEREKSKSL